MGGNSIENGVRKRQKKRIRQAKVSKDLIAHVVVRIVMPVARTAVLYSGN